MRSRIFPTTIPAAIALLSILAVTGLTVNDTYAQSNTDRLIAIDAAIASIEDVVDGTDRTVGGLSGMVSAIRDGLSSMAGTLDSIMNGITGMQASVEGMAEEISQIDSKIAGINVAMQGMSGLDARLADIEDGIAMLQGPMGGSESTTQTLGTLANMAIANDERLDQVFDQLHTIQVSLEKANIKIGAVGVASQAPRPGNILFEGESELSVNTYHYAKHGDKTTDRLPSFYELDMTFSCTYVC